MSRAALAVDSIAPTLWSVGTGINRQTAGRKAPTAEASRKYHAALLQFAEHFPSYFEGPPSAVRDFLNSDRGAGRPYSLSQAGFWGMRDQAIAGLRAAGEKPTRANIAKRLGIGVRTLYNYEHRPAGTSSGVRLTIAGSGFRIESGPAPSRSTIPASSGRSRPGEDAPTVPPRLPMRDGAVGTVGAVNGVGA